MVDTHQTKTVSQEKSESAHNINSMKKKSRFALILAVPLLLAGVLCIVFYHLLFCSDILTPVVEWGLSRIIRVPFSVGRVDVLKDPFRVQAKQLRLDLDPESDSYIEIKNLSAHFLFSGQFGQRTLWIDNLAISDVTARLSLDAKLPAKLSVSSPKASPGLLDSFLSAVTFRKMQLRSATLTNGRFICFKEDDVIDLSQMDLMLSPSSVVTGYMAVLIQIPQKEISVSQARIDISADLSSIAAEKEFEGEIFLSAEHIAAKDIELSNIRGRVKAAYAAEKKLLNLKTVALNSIIESGGHKSLQGLLPRPVKMDASAGIDLTHGLLKNATWRLMSDRLALLQGSASAQWKDVVKYEVTISESWLMLEALSSFLPKDELGGSVQLDVKQKADLKGGIVVQPVRERHQLSGSLVVGLRRNDYFFQHKDILARGTLKGTLNLSGVWPGSFDVEGNMESRLTHIGIASVNLNDLNLGFRFKGRYPELQLQNIGFDIPDVELPVASRRLALKKLSGRGVSARLNLKSFSAQLSDFKIKSDKFKPVLINGNYIDSTASFHINSDESGLLSVFKNFEILPADWQFAAGEAFQADFIIDGKRNVVDWQIWSELTGLKFENPTQDAVAEDLKLTVKGNGHVDIDGPEMTGNYGINCGSGEILFDRFYLNFQDNPLSLNGDIMYSGGKGSVEVNNGVLNLEHLVQATLDVERSLSEGGRTRLSIKLPETDIVPLYNLGLKEPFELDNPVLAAAAVAGSLQSEVDIIFDGNDWQVKGRCRWQDGSLAVEEKNVRLDGIQLEFPVWVSSGSEENRGGAMEGNVFIENMKIPFLAKQPLELPLAVTANRISIPQKTSFQAEGSGRIHLFPLTASVGDDRQLQVDTRIDIDAWQFDAGLSRWWPSQGPITINGSLSPVQIGKNRLKCRGILSTSLFNGILDVADPEVEAIFGSTPTLGLDIVLRDMNLAALTDQTNFGKIEGTLQGRIDQLEIVNKQPQRFSLRLETVRRKNVVQKISVEAVESIARIGGGQSPFMGLAGQFAVLFKKFGYSKIGVVASLENDLFRVNGLIHEKGREYFVKKSGLSGVDVVNSNPDNRIGFKDMVKRIQRVLAPNAKPVVR